MDTNATAFPAPIATQKVAFVIRGNAAAGLPSSPIGSLPRDHVIAGAAAPLNLLALLAPSALLALLALLPLLALFAPVVLIGLLAILTLLIPVGLLALLAPRIFWQFVGMLEGLVLTEPNRAPARAEQSTTRRIRAFSTPEYSFS